MVIHSIIKKKEVKIKVRFLNLITERKVILHIENASGSVGLTEHWFSIIGVKIEMSIKYAFEISKMQTYTAVHFTENFEQANDFEDTSLCLCPTLCNPMDCSQFPLSMEFSRQEYWQGVPFPLPGDLPNPKSPAMAGGFFTSSAT